MTIHAMNPIDAAWYHLDGPANLAMVTGVMLTLEPLSFDKVRTVYRERLLTFERFRQRVVERGFPIATPHWEDMPHFDVDQHIHHLALPAPHDEAALRALIAELASTPLNRAQPLWQVHVVDGVGHGSAVIMRYHHCIADGTGMMTVTQRLFDAAPGVLHPITEPADAGQTGEAVESSLISNAFRAVERATSDALATVGSAARAVAHPQDIIDKAAVALGGAGMLLGEMLRWPDPASPLKGEFTPGKRVAWSTPVTVKDVKAIGARTGAKVNDVLIAAMTGALRAYLKQHGVDVNHTTVRAMVPVDLRPPERKGQLGNEFGLVILELAVPSARMDQRLALTKVRMDALKRSPEPIATKLLFDIFGRGPKAVEDMVNTLFGSKASVVMTDVAGPREKIFLAGVPVDRMMFWVPHPGEQLGMGISIYSYRGLASLAIISDAHLVPDPESITALFNQEFAAMRDEIKPRTAKVSVNGRNQDRPQRH